MRKEYGGFLVPKTMFADAFDFVITFVFVLAWLSMNYGNNYLESVKSNNFLVMTNECLAIVQNNKLLFMRFRLLTEWVIFHKFYSSSMLKQWNDVSFFTAPALIYRSGCLMNYFPNFWQSLNMVFFFEGRISKCLNIFEMQWRYPEFWSAFLSRTFFLTFSFREKENGITVSLRKKSKNEE